MAVALGKGPRKLLWLFVPLFRESLHHECPRKGNEEIMQAALPQPLRSLETQNKEPRLFGFSAPARAAMRRDKQCDTASSTVFVDVRWEAMDLDGAYGLHVAQSQFQPT